MVLNDPIVISRFDINDIVKYKGNKYVIVSLSLFKYIQGRGDDSFIVTELIYNLCDINNEFSDPIQVYEQHLIEHN